jgi:hypothetical protein
MLPPVNGYDKPHTPLIFLGFLRTKILKFLKFLKRRQQSCSHLQSAVASFNTETEDKNRGTLHSSYEIRGRIASQANKWITHFYGLGAHPSASNFPGAAFPCPTESSGSSGLASQEASL